MRETSLTLFAWIIPAFIPRGSLVDHSWVTSYNAKNTPHTDLASVKAANEHFWFCAGSFHAMGKPSDPIIQASGLLKAPICLVGSNNKKMQGTIRWYGIDGVCHQISNQVLYAIGSKSGVKPPTVERARGYRISSTLYGTYGRLEAEWAAARVRCGIAPASATPWRGSASLFSRRLGTALKVGVQNTVVQNLEGRRIQLLKDIDAIGFAERAPNETIQDRVGKLNDRINFFLEEISQYLVLPLDFEKLFGIPKDERIYLIDPELFVFPDPQSRPERSATLGW